MEPAEVCGVADGALQAARERALEERSLVHLLERRVGGLPGRRVVHARGLELPEDALPAASFDPHGGRSPGAGRATVVEGAIPGQAVDGVVDLPGLEAPASQALSKLAGRQLAAREQPQAGDEGVRRGVILRSG